LAIAKMSFDEKWNFFDEIENKGYLKNEEFSILSQLSVDNDEEVRNRTAQVLVFAPQEIAESLLISMLDDEDEMVRVNTCDSLGCGKTKEAINLLFKKLGKDSFLVRGYAVQSIADITVNGKHNTDDISVQLKEEYNREKSSWVKASYHYAFYVLGEQEYYQELINQINHRSYQMRCATINSIDSLNGGNQLNKTIEVLKNRLLVEKSLAVKSSIMRTLACLEKL